MTGAQNLYRKCNKTRIQTDVGKPQKSPQHTAHRKFDVRSAPNLMAN